MAVVVPCYNEEKRLDVDTFYTFAQQHSAFHFVFVNDGSRDNTAQRLAELCERLPKRFSWLDLEKNGGKAEAVRRGVIAALERHPEHVGFWDADLATPLWELPAFLDVFDRRADVELVVGSRVRLMGRSIQRKAARHLSGRVFATAASLTLGLPFYDTQCGAKAFRVTDTTPALFQRPFNSRWLFDVELCARLVQARGREETLGLIYEYPLREWVDVDGSKLTYWDFIRATGELYGIYREYASIRDQ